MIAAQITYGTLASWLTFVTVAVAAVWFGRYVRAGQAGTALTVLEAANRVLGDEVARLRLRVAELEKTHTLEPILRSIEQHEERAAVRGDANLAVLNMIAARLGPDGGEGE